MKQKNMKTYKIELTEKQLNVYKDALEFYSRFISGQIDHLPPIIDTKLNISWANKRNACDYLKQVLFPKLQSNASYGVGWSDKDKLQQEIQISYEMYREVYVKQRKEETEEEYEKKSNSVYDSSTLHYSDQPLPKVENV